VEATEHLAYSFSLQSAGIRYDANLANVLHTRFSIAWCRGKIVRLTARDGERPVRLQWIQAADSNVHIQLAKGPALCRSKLRPPGVARRRQYAVLIEYVGTSAIVPLASIACRMYESPDYRFAVVDRSLIPM
jgi:hypothetical protein